MLHAPESGVYIHQLSCTLEGTLDRDAFAAAWDCVVDRHPVLRTSFVWHDLDRPLQRVHRHVNLDLEEHDWTRIDPSVRSQRLELFLAGERRRGYELVAPPLMRLSLLRFDSRLYGLVWSHHHLILDGWSVPVLIRELFTAYVALRHGLAPRLDPARPYADYVAWLQRQDATAAAAYWRRSLAGFTAPTPLPGRPPAAGSVEEIRERIVELPPGAGAAVRRHLRSAGLTENSLMQGLWALLLSHHGGVDDVVFGTTVSVRPPELDGVETMVGVLLNTVPVRVDVPRGGDVLIWLTALQQRQAEMRQFQHTPLVEVQGCSELPRGSQLFGSVLTIQNYPLAQSLAELDSGLTVRDVRFVEKATYPLSLALLPGERMPLQLRFDPARFDDDVVERMLGHLVAMLIAFGELPAPLMGDLRQRMRADDQARSEDRDVALRSAGADRLKRGRRRSVKVGS